MSEHIQPASAPHSGHAVAAEGTHEHTPGVSHERDKFSLRLLVWCGVGLVGTGIVIHLAVWWTMEKLKNHNALPSGSISELARDDAARPLEQRVANMPAPHLEGIDPLSTLLLFRTEEGKEERFYVVPSVRVQLGNKKDASLYELHLGQRATITYHMPGGVPGALGIVTTVISPPGQGEKKAGPERQEVSRTLNGEIIKLEPQDVAAAREWAERQSRRYGWIDRDKGIVHIPIARAMQEVLQTKEFRADGDKKKGEGRTPLPTRASSGRAATGGQR